MITKSQSKNHLINLDWHFIVIFSIPLILLIINDAWIYNADGVDTWYYYSHFFNWQEIVQLHPFDYIGTRLSYIVPGYIIHSLFPTLIANALFKLIVYWSSAFSFYLILKFLSNRKAAFFTTLLFILYVPFVAASGWTYVDGAGIAYFLLTTLSLIYGVTKERRRTIWMVVAGAMFANLVYTNLFLAIFGVSLLYLFLTFNTRQDYIRLALWAGMGAIGMTAFWGFISVLAGNDFLFFMPSIEFMTNQVQSLETDAVVPTRPWIPLADHIVVPITAVVLSIIRLLGNTESNKNNIHLYIYHLIIFGCFVLMQFIGIRVLQVPFYATYLIPSSFFVIGLFLYTYVERLPQRYFVFLSAAIFIVCSIPFAWEAWRFYARTSDLWDTSILMSIFVVIAGFGGFFILKRFGKPGIVLGILAVVSGLTVAGYRSIINDVEIDTSYWNQVSYLNRDHRDLLLAATDTIEVVEAITPAQDVFFWRNVDPLLQSKPIISITSLYMRSLIGNFPEIQNNWVPIELYDGMIIALIDYTGDLLEPATALLTERGFDANVIEETVIERGQYTFHLTFVELAAID